MSIHILSKDITQKIAAGEVVERPSSVVKELIENSIDAKACNITIEIENGGLSYIRITDNGCGMNDEDSLLCFKPHATSKIIDEEDLFNIATLGFRGEAIPSICAVSKMTLYTRTKTSEYAMKIVNHGGEILSQEKCGRPEGTTIIVEDIFYNVPARLKFLKSAASETGQISNIVQKYVLARPDIAFRFISNGKDVYVTTGDGNLKNAILAVYGQNIYSELIPVNYDNENISIKGYIGDPSNARGTRSAQNLFVNGRFIRSEAISDSIKLGYSNRIMPAKHPFFALNLQLPYSDIDVNVHPNKLDVRFKNEYFVRECFFKAVKEAFEQLSKAPKSQPDIVNPQILAPEKSNREAITHSLIDLVNAKVEAPVSFETKKADFAAQNINILQREVISSKEEDYVYPEFTEPTPTVVTVKKDAPITTDEPLGQTELQLNLSDTIGAYNIIGQIFNTYILVEYEDKLLLIDQHAAHERLNTNKMLKEFEESNILKQKLLIPSVLQLTADEFNTAIESVELFNELGFEIEEFGDNVIRINTVPHIFGEENIENFFFETMDALKGNPKMDTRKHIIFDTACKHSIKAGQRLNNDEIKELISQSIKDKSPLNCPHGRPIVIIKSKKEIEKWFMRIV